MITNQSALKETAQQWLPFGGPPAEEILVRFGITLDVFYRRLAHIIRHDTASTTRSALLAMIEFSLDRRAH